MKKLFLILLCLPTLIFAQTNVGGNITTNTTWSLSNNPYILTADVNVFPNVTLVIDSGVIVQGQYDLNIRGELNLLGKRNYPVICRDLTIVFNNAQNSSVVFNDDTLQYLNGSYINYLDMDSAGGINITGTEIFINNSIVTNCGSGITSDANLFLQSTEITNNSGNGVDMMSSGANDLLNIVGCVITGNIGGYAINLGGTLHLNNSSIIGGSISTFNQRTDISNSYIKSNIDFINHYQSHSSSPNIIENTIIDIEGGYIDTYYASNYYKSSLIKNANIDAFRSSLLMENSRVISSSISFDEGTYPKVFNINNSSFSGYINDTTLFGSIEIQKVGSSTFQYNKLELQNFTNSYGPLTVNAENNYWSVNDTNQIDSIIVDIYDNINYGTINYHPVLNIAPFDTITSFNTLTLYNDSSYQNLSAPIVYVGDKLYFEISTITPRQYGIDFELLSVESNSDTSGTTVFCNETDTATGIFRGYIEIDHKTWFNRKINANIGDFISISVDENPMLTQTVLVGSRVYGCIDSLACNYDSLANTLDNSCVYPTMSTDTQVHCDTYTWIDGVTYTSSNNTANLTSTNVSGCDSIITLDLTITNSSNSVDIHTVIRQTKVDSLV